MAFVERIVERWTNETDVRELSVLLANKGFLTVQLLLLIAVVEFLRSGVLKLVFPHGDKLPWFQQTAHDIVFMGVDASAIGLTFTFLAQLLAACTVMIVSSWRRMLSVIRGKGK